MTLKHSPGPWTTDFFGRLIYDSQNAAICEIWDDQKRPENSRLIAAAPDMLRLLRVVCDQRNTWEELIAAIDEGRGVIAKLDGDT